MRFIKHHLVILSLFTLMFSSAVSQQYNESNDFSYALKLYNEGFYDIAAQQFSTFINRYPGSERLADARYYYGDALYKLKDYDGARIEFQGLAVSFPDHSRAPQGWQMVGECYKKLNKPEEAAKAFETVKILYPKNALAPGALLSASELYMQVEQYNRAEQILREFLDRYLESSEYPRGRILYGRLLLQKGEPERAASEFRRVPELTENKAYRAEAQLGEATVYQQLGLRTRSISTLESILAKHSGTEPAYQALLTLSRIYRESRDWEKVLQLIRKESSGYDSDQQERQLKLIQAQTLFLKGDFYASGKILEELIKSADNAELAFTAKFYLACCDLEEKNAAEAANAFNNLLKKNDSEDAGRDFKAVILFNLTKLYLKQEDFQQARNYVIQYQTMNSGDPNSEKLHRDLIYLALKKNLLSAGIDELQRFRGAYPKSSFRDDLIFQAGKAFFHDRQYDRSLLFFEQVAGEYPCSAARDSSQAYIRFIQTYYKSGQQTGVNELAKLMGKMLTGEDRKLLLFELGRIYITDLRDYREAGRILERYVTDSRQDSAATAGGLYYLGESYLRLAEHNDFLGLPSTEYHTKAANTLKDAMAYVKYAPQPDTLTFRFISETAPAESTTPDKLLKFWQHFEQNYPKSTLIPLVQLRIADALVAKGELAEAIARLDQLISSGKKDYYTGTAFWKKAQLSEKQGNLDIAIQTLKDFLLEYTHHPYQAKAYWKLADYHGSLGEFSTAAKFLERILELFDYSEYAEEAPARITDYYIRDGQYSQALAYVESEISDYQIHDDLVIRHYLTSPPPVFYFYAGKAYFQQNEYRKSRRNLLSFLNFSQNSSSKNEALLLLGKMARAEEDYESALVQLSLIKKEDDPAIFYQGNEIAADILFNQGRYDDALKKYEMLISQISNVDKKIYLDAQKLRCLINQDKTSAFGASLSAFKKTYDKHPEIDRYLAVVEYENARVDFAKKRFDKSIDHCKTVIKKYKKTEYVDDAQYLIGLSYATLNRTEDALKVLSNFLKEYPQSGLVSSAYLTLAQIYFRGEKNELGLDAARKAVETALDAASKKEALSMLISTYKRLGLWDGALTSAREYVSSYPNADDLMDKKITVGNALIRLNRFTEAVDYFKTLKFEANSEQEPEIQFYIGEAYYNSGQYEDAIKEFVKIPLLSQKTKLQWEASAFYYAGQAYEKLGRINDAIRMYQEIVERPGIEYDLKRQARQLIDNLKSIN